MRWNGCMQEAYTSVIELVKDGEMLAKTLNQAEEIAGQQNCPTPGHRNLWNWGPEWESDLKSSLLQLESVFLWTHECRVK